MRTGTCSGGRTRARPRCTTSPSSSAPAYARQKMQPSCSSALPTYSSRHGAHRGRVTRPLLSGRGRRRAGSVCLVNRAGLAFLAAVVVALGGASSVQAVDPLHECFGLTETIVGTPGNDVLAGTPEADVIKAGAGDDTIDGAGGDDIICGDDGNDTITGGTGDDAISGDAGDDHVDGGQGFDIAFFFASPTGVTADLSTNTATGWGTDTLANFEGLVGSLNDDLLTGDGDRQPARRPGGQRHAFGRRGLGRPGRGCRQRHARRRAGHGPRVLRLLAEPGCREPRVAHDPRLGNGHAARHRGPARLADRTMSLSGTAGRTSWTGTRAAIASAAAEARI